MTPKTNYIWFGVHQMTPHNFKKKPKLCLGDILFEKYPQSFGNSRASSVWKRGRGATVRGGSSNIALNLRYGINIYHKWSGILNLWNFRTLKLRNFENRNNWFWGSWSFWTTRWVDDRLLYSNAYFYYYHTGLVYACSRISMCPTSKWYVHA